MAKSLETAIDCALDDLVKGRGKKGKGRGGGGKGKGKGKDVKKQGFAKLSAKEGKEKKDPPTRKVEATKATAQAKVDMALEDIVKSQTGKKAGKGAVEKKTDAKATAKGKGRGTKLWGGAAKMMQNRRKVVVITKVSKGRKGGGKYEKSYEYEKGGGKSSWKSGGKGYRKGDWGGDYDSWGGGGKGRKGGGKNKNRKGGYRWNREDWDDSWGGDRKGDRKGKGKGRDSWGGRGKENYDDWEPPAKRQRRDRDEQWDDSYKKDSRDSWAPPSRERAPPARDYSPPRRAAPERRPAPERRITGNSDRESARRVSNDGKGGGGGGMARGLKRALEEPDRAERSSNGRKIKVTNIPRDLDMPDIKEAFEAEAGKVVDCRMERNRGVAYLTFNHPKDARKAVDTFDRGELNGKTIEVTFER